MHYVLQQFLKAKLWWDNTSLQKIKRSSAQNKKTFKLMYVHVQYAYTCEWPGLRKELLQSLPKAQLTHSSFRTGMTISSMLLSTTSFHQLPAGRPSPTFTVCDCVSGWQTIPGQWPWQTAAYALLLAHSSLISISQLVPLSFYSCCHGICWDTHYCAAATGLLRPEVGSRVWANEAEIQKKTLSGDPMETPCNVLNNS